MHPMSQTNPATRADSKPNDIAPEMTMGTLLSVYPGARRALFREYHIGGCSHCGFDLEETLESVCNRNNALNPYKVVSYLLASEEEDRKLMITPAELEAELSADPPPTLLDIRSRDEFDAVAIPGSFHFDQKLMQKILAEWDRVAPIVVVDHDGSRGLDAAAFFAGHGFSSVRALTGGIDAFSRDIDPSLPRYTLE